MASTEESTSRRQQLGNLIWLTGKSVTPTLLRNCKALITLVGHHLECPEDQHDGLSHILQSVLTEVIAEKREEALDGFKQARQAQKTLPLEIPAGQAALVAAFGELLDQGSEETTLRELASVRNRPNSLKQALETARRQVRRQLLAGLWWPPGDILPRQVRRYVREFKEGEPMWTAATLDALDKHLRLNTAELRAQLAGLNTPANYNGNQPLSKPDEAEDDRYPPGYIPRPECHARFSQLLAEKYKYIVLSGLPGIGKSSLADALTRSHLPEGEIAPIIEFVDNEPTLESIEGALQDCNMETELEKISAQPKAYLSKLLRSNNAPEFIIFDNLDNLEGVSRLLPPRGKSTVVITCRAVTHLGRWHEVIPVDWMTDEQARALVKSHLPALSDEDATFLGASLYGYPILIRHACVLYAHQSMQVKEFCADIHADIKTVAQNTMTDEGKAVFVVLRRMVKLLKKGDRLAYDMLPCWTFVDASSPCLKFITNYLYVKGGEMPSKVSLLQALHTMINYSFLEVERNSASKGRPGFVMHSLTRELMRHLIADQSDRAAEYAACVYQLALQEFRELTEPRGFSSHFLERRIAPAIQSNTQNVTHTIADYYRRFNLAIYFGQLIIDNLPLRQNLADIQEQLAQHPGKRLGTILTLYGGPDERLQLLDADAHLRPSEGPEVEILGYRFKLIDKDSSQDSGPGQVT